MEEAEQEAQELFKLNENDELALWYMSKICRQKSDLYGERQYLEKLIDVSPPISQIKGEQRLETVKNIIAKQEEKEELERAKQECYTEELRQEFIQDIEKRFIEGKISLKNIDEEIEKAKKYPNFIQSLIDILNLKTKITENLQEKIDILEEYVDNTYTLTPEQYDTILNEIVMTREGIKREEQIQKMLDEYYEADEYEQQRQYSKQIISRLNNGEITKEEVPSIVAKLETFKDRVKTIVLIVELKKAVCGDEEAKQALIKYSSIGLSEEEQQEIEELLDALDSSKKNEGPPPQGGSEDGRDI